MGLWDFIGMLKPGMDADERALLNVLEKLRDHKRKADEERRKAIEEAENEILEALDFLKDKDENEKRS